MTTISELKTCPFCGKAPTHQHEVILSTNPLVSYAEFIICYTCEICLRSKDGVSATDRWNTRYI